MGETWFQLAVRPLANLMLGMETLTGMHPALVIVATAIVIRLAMMPMTRHMDAQVLAMMSARDSLRDITETSRATRAEKTQTAARRMHDAGVRPRGCLAYLALSIAGLIAAMQAVNSYCDVETVVTTAYQWTEITAAEARTLAGLPLDQRTWASAVWGGAVATGSLAQGLVKRRAYQVTPEQMGRRAWITAVGPCAIGMFTCMWPTGGAMYLAAHVGAGLIIDQWRAWKANNQGGAPPDGRTNT